MIWIIGGTIAVIYELLAFIITYTGIELYYSSGVLTSFSILFLLSLFNTKILYNTLLLTVLLITLLVSIYRLFISSNHYLISLDIVCFFTVLILTLFKTLKISKVPA